jgi:hypothetical protein
MTQNGAVYKDLGREFPTRKNRELFRDNRDCFAINKEFVSNFRQKILS